LSSTQRTRNPGWADCFTQDFSREDLRDLELAARFWPASPVIQSN